MAQWWFSYHFKIGGEFSPLTIQGPPYEQLTIEAPTALEAAKIAKDELPNHFLTQFKSGRDPFGQTADDVDFMILMRCDADEDALQEADQDIMSIMGLLMPTTVDYATLTVC